MVERYTSVVLAKDPNSKVCSKGIGDSIPDSKLVWTFQDFVPSVSQPLVSYVFIPKTPIRGNYNHLNQELLETLMQNSDDELKDRIQSRNSIQNFKYKISPTELSSVIAALNPTAHIIEFSNRWENDPEFENNPHTLAQISNYGDLCKILKELSEMRHTIPGDISALPISSENFKKEFGNYLDL